jgi:hypothetical protein
LQIYCISASISESVATPELFFSKKSFSVAIFLTESCLFITLQVLEQGIILAIWKNLVIEVNFVQIGFAQGVLKGIEI